DGSSNPLLLPTNNIVLGGSGGDRSVTLTPLPNQFGTSTVTLTVTDTNFGAANTSFVLTVIPGNDSPTISGISDVTSRGGPGTGPITFKVGDPETPSDRLTVTGSSSNPDLVPNARIVFG